MKSDPDNLDLAEAFEALKAADAVQAPPFEIYELGQRQRTWRAGPGLYVACLAGVAAVILCLFFVVTGSNERIPAGEPIAFDHLNEVISRELFVASVTEWESPTDFLLNPDPFETQTEIKK